MSTELDEKTEDTTNSGKRKMRHLFCECDGGRALCGKSLTGGRVVSPHPPEECVVCVDLEFQPCERCGHRP